LRVAMGIEGMAGEPREVVSYALETPWPLRRLMGVGRFASEWPGRGRALPAANLESLGSYDCCAEARRGGWEKWSVPRSRCLITGHVVGDGCLPVPRRW